MNMKKMQDIAAFLFIIAVSVLAIVAIFGVWDILDKDVISKSFQTLGILAVVAIMVMISGRFIDRHSSEKELGGVISEPHPAFKTTRHVTLGILIVSVSLLALLGVLTIWEIIFDKDILYKSIGSMGILAFSSFIIVLTALEREGKTHHRGKKFSVGSIILILLLVYLLFGFFRSFY